MRRLLIVFVSICACDDAPVLPGENRSVMGFNLIWMFDRIVELGELLRDLTALQLPAPKVGWWWCKLHAVDPPVTLKKAPICS